jgi:ribosomal protein S18 acetylase RimI-like enzyme
MKFVKLTTKELEEYKKHAIGYYSHLLYKYQEYPTKEEARAQAENTVSSHLSKTLESQDYHIYNIIVDNKPIGYLWYLIEENTIAEGPCAFLDYIYIKPKKRRKGYAEQALLKYESEAKSLGAVISWLYVFEKDIPAVNMYKKHSYNIAKEIKCGTAKKNTRYIMYKKLR